MIYKMDDSDNSTDIILKKELMKKYYQSNKCLEKLLYIRERLTPRAFKESYASVSEDLRTLQIEIDTLEEVRRKSKKTHLTSEQEKEEELFKTYGLLNNTLWMLVMGNTRFEERTPLLNKFDAYRSKISVLEHTLYFNGRIDSEVEALDRARMDSVSEAIPGFDYIKII